jgi:hypothetical protein
VRWFDPSTATKQNYISVEIPASSLLALFFRQDRRWSAGRRRDGSAANETTAADIQLGQRLPSAK